MRVSSSAFTRGFTLLEVLAALVIVSLGLLAVIEAVGQTASNSSRMQDRTIAHWVAMNKLTATRLEPRAPKIDKSSDEVEMAGRRWRWTMEVTETPVQSLRRIDIRVAEAEADENASLVSVTGFYGTAIAATAMGTSIWQTPAGPLLPGTEQDQQTPPPDNNDGDGSDDVPTPDPGNEDPPPTNDVEEPPQ